MLKIDISKVKKIASDDKTTTLKHEKGHTIIIAHKALHPKMKDQLDKLPHYDQGGDVSSSPPEAPKKNAEAVQKGATQSGYDPSTWVSNIKQGLGIDSKAKGGEVKQSNPKLEESKKVPPQAPMSPKVMQQPMRMMADGGDVDDEAPDTDKSPKEILDSADSEAIQPYGPVDAAVEAAKWVGKKVLDNMTQDTELYRMDPQAWAAKHALNMAMGTIGAAGPKAPFHELAKMQKAEQLAKGVGEPAPTVGAAIEKGPISGANYQANIDRAAANGQQPPQQGMAYGGLAEDDSNGQQIPGVSTASQDREAALTQAQQNDAYKQQLSQNGIDINTNPSPSDAQPNIDSQQPSSLMSSSQDNSQPGDEINPYSGYQQEVGGIQAQANAESALAHAKVRQYDAAANQNTELQKKYLDSYNALDQERLAHIADIKAGAIDPDKYWDNHSKILSGIGILLGGFAGGKTGVNPGYDALQTGINRSIQAQAQNLNSDHNLLAANLQQFGNMRDAYSMTKVMMNDALGHQIDSAVAASSDPMAQARAQVLKGQLQRQVAPEMIKLGMHRALMGMTNQQSSAGGSNQQPDPAQMLPYLRQLAPEVAKEWEGRIVPGINGQPSQMAQIPIPQATRDQLVAKQQLGSMARDFYDWASKNSGSVDPATINEGKTKAAELQSMYRNSINGGVFKKGEQEFIGNIIDEDPTKFFNKLRVLPQLKEVINSNDKQLNTLKQGYGIPPQNPTANLPPQQQAFVKWAQANPNDPRAEIVLRKLGLH